MISISSVSHITETTLQHRAIHFNSTIPRYHHLHKDDHEHDEQAIEEDRVDERTCQHHADDSS